MGTLILSQIKKQASSYLNEKYQSARLVLSDVTPAQILAEDATNSEPCTPNANTMTKIAEASLEFDDYWRIADVLHQRFNSIDKNNWRQSRKILVLLEFLLTHGPEEFAQEFKHQQDVVRELGTLKYKDENGFDWGMNMKNRSERILDLLGGGERLRQARLKALRITKEIKGFGNSMESPQSSSSSSPTLGSSSFGSYSSSSTASWHKRKGEKEKKSVKGSDEENDYFIDSEDEEHENEDKLNNFYNGIHSKVAFRSLSDVGRVRYKKINRQLSGEY